MTRHERPEHAQAQDKQQAGRPYQTFQRQGQGQSQGHTEMSICTSTAVPNLNAIAGI